MDTLNAWAILLTSLSLASIVNFMLFKGVVRYGVYRDRHTIDGRMKISLKSLAVIVSFFFLGLILAFTSCLSGYVSYSQWLSGPGTGAADFLAFTFYNLGDLLSEDRSIFGGLFITGFFKFILAITYFAFTFSVLMLFSLVSFISVLAASGSILGIIGSVTEKNISHEVLGLIKFMLICAVVAGIFDYLS